LLAIVIILIISQIECVSALSATIVDADLIFVSTIGHGSKYAGIIYIALDGDTTRYPTYCIDIDISTQNGNRYELGGSGADPNIIWILNNYYPNTGLPDGLTNTEKGAAVQLAIWHFSNGLDLSSGTPGNVFAAARAIVDSVGSASIPQIPSTLGLSPASSTNPLGAQHTVTATVLDPSGSAVSGQEVTFSVTGANPTTNPVSVVTDANGQSAFTYTGANAGDDTIAATTSFIVPSGAIWIGATSSIQRLVMAQDVPRSLTQSASKRWRDLTAPTIPQSCPQPIHHAAMRMST
jgi:TQXA domain-containing protein